MAKFDSALQFTLINEGGFVSNPLDRGHATNYGISTQTLSDFLARPATEEDVKNITDAQVRIIYQAKYWSQMQGDKLTYQASATSLFDMSVLMGPRQAVKLAQRIVNAVDDGVMGPKTVSAVNARDSLNFVTALSLASARFFAGIVIKDNSQEVFLDGWLVRAYKMLTRFDSIGGKN
ncbi:MAG: hypothetical protein EOO38_00190 [Cytophagaceae bacterium]|nr:MAG: hypothetical protein EOO38_00190 [Cytophagaceae bacterium]